MKVARIDSHQHFWTLARGDYTWLTPALAPLYCDFTPQDLAPLLAAANVSQTVAVQAAASVAETEFLLRQAAEHAFIAAVVGWVDFTAADAIDQLERLKTNTKFVGLRPMLQDIADPAWMLSPQFQPIYRYLADHRLTFDALVKPAHLAALYTLAARYSDLQIVVDHAGKPNMHEPVSARWAADVARLATLPNVHCKLSGLLTEAPPGANATLLSPWFDRLLNCFGPQRLLWGSDWPVVNLAADYVAWVSHCEALLAPLSATEQQAIWATNTHNFYHLAPVHQG